MRSPDRRLSALGTSPLMTGFRFLSRPGLVLALAIALASACSSGNEQPTETTSGAAGQGQAGSAGAPSTAGSSGAAGSGTAGAGGSGGAAGSTSGGGLPGIRLEDCTGLVDGAICDPSSGFVSASNAFCVREECHRISEFVVTCWNMVPTCIEGESFAIHPYDGPQARGRRVGRKGVCGAADENRASGQ